MVWRNLSCRFLKVWGCNAYVKKFQSDKLEPKADKMLLHRVSKTVGYISYLRSESKVFVSRNGSFLEERFLSKELSGRVVELDEVIEPSLQPVCSRAQEVVHVAPTPN